MMRKGYHIVSALSWDHGNSLDCHAGKHHRKARRMLAGIESGCAFGRNFISLAMEREVPGAYNRIPRPLYSLRGRSSRTFSPSTVSRDISERWFGGWDTYR